MNYFPYTENAYEAYRKRMEQDASVRSPMKDWEELPEFIREAWSDAVQAAFETHESHEGPFQDQ